MATVASATDHGAQSQSFPEYSPIIDACRFDDRLGSLPVACFTRGSRSLRALLPSLV